jgi:hypothetical protein
MSAEMSSLTEENKVPNPNIEEVVVYSTVRTEFLSTIFPRIINKDVEREDKVAIRLENARKGNDFGADSWNCTLMKEGGVKYIFTLSERPEIELTIRDSEGEEMQENVYSYELELVVPFEGEEIYKELEEFNLGVYLGRRINGQRSIGFKDLRYGHDFSLQDLAILDNREFKDLLSEVSGIPRVKGLEINYDQGLYVNTVSLEISF